MIGSDSASLQQQCDLFDGFQRETVHRTAEVEELLSSADEVEAGIKTFHSELGKKASSLKAVWDKFLQRVTNRGVVLSGALVFYSAKEQVCTCLCCRWLRNSVDTFFF